MCRQSALCLTRTLKSLEMAAEVEFHWFSGEKMLALMAAFTSRFIIGLWMKLLDNWSLSHIQVSYPGKITTYKHLRAKIYPLLAVIYWASTQVTHLYIQICFCYMFSKWPWAQCCNEPQCWKSTILKKHLESISCHNVF